MPHSPIAPVRDPWGGSAIGAGLAAGRDGFPWLGQLARDACVRIAVAARGTTVFSARKSVSGGGFPSRSPMEPASTAAAGCDSAYTGDPKFPTTRASRGTRRRPRRATDSDREGRLVESSWQRSVQRGGAGWRFFSAARRKWGEATRGLGRWRGMCGCVWVTP